MIYITQKEKQTNKQKHFVSVFYVRDFLQMLAEVWLPVCNEELNR